MKNKKAFSIIFFVLTLLTSCQNKSNNKLTFSSWGSLDEVNILKPILENFTKKTGIEVELIHIPDNYFQKVHMMFASDTAPDVVFMNNLTMPVYADSGVFENLDTFIEKDNEVKKDDFFPQVIEAMKWKGKLYGLPRDISNLLIYYNKDMFDKYKVAYPKSNWTFDDFLETSKKLTKDIDNDGKSDTYGFALDKRPLFWLPFVWSSGGDVFNKDLSAFSLNTPESIKGLQLYTDLRNKHKVAPSEKEVGNTKTAQLFSQEKIGMQLSGRWSVPTYKTTLKFKWDVAPFPKMSNGSIVDVDASGWCISKSSSNKENAWKLVKFLANKESITSFSSGGLIVPSRKDVSEDFMKEKVPENSKAFIEIIDSGRPIKTTPNWNEISTEMDLGLENIWEGKEEISSATEKIAKRVNTLLK
ncbi:MAG: sugar ABC transporter substrate-binding protein [Candidatus Sericytochromatia bacterium]